MAVAMATGGPPEVGANVGDCDLTPHRRPTATSTTTTATAAAIARVFLVVYLVQRFANHVNIVLVGSTLAAPSRQWRRARSRSSSATGTVVHA